MAPWDGPGSTATLTDNYIRLEERVGADGSKGPTPLTYPLDFRPQEEQGIRKTVRMETSYSVKDDNDTHPPYRAVVVGRQGDIVCK